MFLGMQQQQKKTTKKAEIFWYAFNEKIFCKTSYGVFEHGLKY